MNPFLQQVLGSAARVAIIWVAAQAGHDLNDEQAAKIFLTYVVPASMLAWSIVQKYRNQQKLTTALAAPTPMTQQQVEAQISSGGAASALTPKHEIPQ